VVGATPSVLAGLRRSGLTVLSAATAEEAIQTSVKFEGEIELLLTEVMMPGMSGADLAKRLREQRTKLRVMMMTGYANGDLLVLNYGWQMAKQPSVATLLTAKVRDILDTPDRSQGTDQFDTRKDVK